MKHSGKRTFIFYKLLKIKYQFLYLFRLQMYSLKYEPRIAQIKRYFKDKYKEQLSFNFNAVNISERVAGTRTISWCFAG